MQTSFSDSPKTSPLGRQRKGSAPRKPRQERLPLKAKFKHGGLRKGAGRPKSEFLSHSAREKLTGIHPLHITFKIKSGLPNLRQKKFYQAFRKSVLKAHKKGLNLLHFSILSNHVHMIVEIQDNKTLHSALKSLNTAFAKRVNFLTGRVGKVLRERFHLHVLKTPREYFNVLRYVLGNAEKHGCVENEIDLYSSAMMFGAFEVLMGSRKAKKLRWPPRDRFRKGVDFLKPILSNPGTWLARTGWVRGVVAA
jgi:REP element-mobilizing transposase RayT